MVDPFSDDDLDPSRILSRVGPSLGQYLCMERRKSERVAITILIRAWPYVSVSTFKIA